MLASTLLNDWLPLQKTPGLATLRSLGPIECTYAHPHEAVDEIAREVRRDGFGGRNDRGWGPHVLNRRWGFWAEREIGALPVRSASQSNPSNGWWSFGFQSARDREGEA